MLLALLDDHDDRMLDPGVMRTAWRLTFEFEWEMWDIDENGIVELYLLSEDWDEWKELWKRDDDDKVVEGRWAGLDSNQYVRMDHLNRHRDVKALARIIEDLNPVINISVVSPGDMRCHTADRYRARMWFNEDETLFEFSQVSA